MSESWVTGRHMRCKMLGRLHPRAHLLSGELNDRLYLGQHEIDDEAAFADYLKETMPFTERHGGRYLTKADTHEMQGQWPSRVVVVEFPSKQAIKDWYNDPGYRPLIAKRHAAARGVMIAVEGR